MSEGPKLISFPSHDDAAAIREERERCTETFKEMARTAALFRAEFFRALLAEGLQEHEALYIAAHGSAEI